jgi:hypothetical protein
MLNDSERHQLEKKVVACGLSVSSYIRLLIIGYEPKPKPPPEYYEILKELHAIGNNLNQIAAKVNALNLIDAQEYRKNVDLLMKSLLELQANTELPERRLNP